MKRLVTVTLLFSLLIVPIASSQTSAKANKATVIFYRSTLFGAAYGYKLTQGDSTLTKIKYKTFYVIELNEGTYNYLAKNCGGKYAISLNVKAGHTYFIKCKTGFSVPVNKPKLILLTDEQTKKEASKSYLKQKLSEHNIKI